MLSFVVSSMLFGCAIVAVLMVLFLYCLHNQLARTFIATKITSARLPPPSNYVIDIGLANVLLALYIGINEDMVGPDVMLHDLALWVGVLTMCMVMLDTIMTLALYIALSDGKLQLGEYTFLQIMHFFRYLLKKMHANKHGSQLPSQLLICFYNHFYCILYPIASCNFITYRNAVYRIILKSKISAIKTVHFISCCW